MKDPYFVRRVFLVFGSLFRTLRSHGVTAAPRSTQPPTTARGEFPNVYQSMTAQLCAHD